MEELKTTLSRTNAITHIPKFRPNDIANTSSSSFEKRILDDEANSPALVYRSEIENYLREAKCRLEVFVYQCECWSEGIYFTIPFCQRAELGLKPFTRAYQKQNELPDNLTLTAVQQHKNFKFSPPGFVIKYTHMNVLGAVKQASAIDTKPYNSIIISNIPSINDKGAVPPNPTKPWLEMQTSENDPKKRKTKAEDSVICYHLSQLELESDDKKEKKFPYFVR